MRRDDGRALIADFGIARTVGQEQLTRSGLVTGTPAYFAPELARGAGALPRLRRVGARRVALRRGRGRAAVRRAGQRDRDAQHDRERAAAGADPGGSADHRPCSTCSTRTRRRGGRWRGRRGALRDARLEEPPPVLPVDDPQPTPVDDPQPSPVDDPEPSQSAGTGRRTPSRPGPSGAAPAPPQPAPCSLTGGCCRRSRRWSWSRWWPSAAGGSPATPTTTPAPTRRRPGARRTPTPTRRRHRTPTPRLPLGDASPAGRPHLDVRLEPSATRPPSSADRLGARYGSVRTPAPRPSWWPTTTACCPRTPARPGTCSPRSCRTDRRGHLRGVLGHHRRRAGRRHRGGR